MSQSLSPQTYYASHSLFTDPADMAFLFADLPTDIPALAQLVQGLLLHPFEAELYQVDLSIIQRKEVNIRTVAEMLRRLRGMDNRPLTEARPPAERLIGNHRDHAVLFCSLLRQQGIPARVRVGFAAYLSPTLNTDHWVSEYWQPDPARPEGGHWVMVDAQIDDLQRKAHKITFDTLDLPAGQFFTAGQAWKLCTDSKAKSRNFGRNLKARGWPFMRGSLVQDLATLNKVEVLPTDLWWDLAIKGDDKLNPDDRRLLTRLAGLTLAVDAHFDDVLIAYEGDDQFSSATRSKLILMGLTVDSAPAYPKVHDEPDPFIEAETSPAPVFSTEPEGGAQIPGAVRRNGAVKPAQESRALANQPLRPSDGARLAALARTPQPVQARNGKVIDLPPAGAPLSGVDPDMIVVRGAQQHNLKRVNISIPRNKMVVLTGVSGSGKSSLAFDTLYAEGQRRYVESLSSYVRRYMDQMDKPKVDYIGGLSPAIAIEQKSVSKNPRSTVGTVTEVVDYLRVLYSRAGTQHCPSCGRAVEPSSPQMAADGLAQLPPGTRYQVLAPVVRAKKGDHAALLEGARKDGFSRAIIDGEMVELLTSTKLPKLAKTQPHTIDLVVDRLVVPPAVADGADDEDLRQDWKDYAVRVIDSVETAFKAARGTLAIDLGDGESILLTEHTACPHCDLTLPALTAALFSFNAPSGMCPECNGLGTKLEVDPNLIVEHPELSILDGASRWWGNVRKKKGWHYNNLKVVAEAYGADLETPWKDLAQDFRDALLFGSDKKLHYKWENQEGTWKGEGERTERGMVFNINRLFRQTQSEGTRRWYASFMSQKPCPACAGTRLCAEARHVTVGGKTFPEVSDMTILNAHQWVINLSEGGLGERMSGEQLEVVGEVLKELRNRLLFMLNVGLHYLSLSRPAPTLSGGEGQRIRLASQLGCGLVGVLYILDEPSIGLHSRDQRNLLDTLLHLRDLGNTVLVVEHDEETMRAADWLVDLGPGAGVMGGEIVSAGTPDEVAADPNSLTGRYLSGTLRVTGPRAGRRQPRGWMTLAGARLFNLKNVVARFPLGAVTCVTGVSGSGKSSLVADTLFPALARNLMNAQTTPGPYDRLEGLDQLDKVINITQEPIGRTPRSNPATYVGVFDEIRKVFAFTPESRTRGYTANRFSFNVKGGRCEACQGHGLKRIEMHFLPDVWVQCQECKGARYNRHTLEITYKGKNIAQVLDMDVQEALAFFENFPKITRVLQTLHDVGLDYVKLGQSATTLSGGEAQRVKLASELCRVATGDTIYILDEPTTGLHFADVQRLLDVLHRLADAGNTVVVIEHNLDVIKTADWLIDLGPEGGAAGGYIIAEGTPEQIAQVETSFTGQFLRPLLELV